MKYEVLKNKIVYFQDVIPNHEDIIKALEETEANDIITPWIKWGNKYATSIEQSLSELDIYGTGRTLYSTIFDNNNKFKEMHWIYNDIHSAILQCSEIYKDLMKIDISINPKIESSGYIIGKYNNNTPRGLHSDCPYDDLEHSYVVYLNDNYDGGFLEFPELEIKFKPTAGSIVMFKSNDVDSIHQASPSSGPKYIIPHFWRMGPSQGFIPYGTSVESYLDFISDEKNLVHDFDNLDVVNKKTEEIING